MLVTISVYQKLRMVILGRNSVFQITLGYKFELLSFSDDPTTGIYRREPVAYS